MAITTVKSIFNRIKIKRLKGLTPLENAYLALLGFEFLPVPECPGWGELVATKTPDVCVVSLPHLRGVMDLGLTSPDDFF